MRLHERFSPINITNVLYFVDIQADINKNRLYGVEFIK